VKYRAGPILIPYLTSSHLVFCFTLNTSSYPTCAALFFCVLRPPSACAGPGDPAPSVLISTARTSPHHVRQHTAHLLYSLLPLPSSIQTPTDRPQSCASPSHTCSAQCLSLSSIFASFFLPSRALLFAPDPQSLCPCGPQAPSRPSGPAQPSPASALSTRIAPGWLAFSLGEKRVSTGVPASHHAPNLDPPRISGPRVPLLSLKADCFSKARRNPGSRPFTSLAPGTTSLPITLWSVTSVGAAISGRGVTPSRISHAIALP
jgi:hypothetical protein